MANRRELLRPWARASDELAIFDGHRGAGSLRPAACAVVIMDVVATTLQNSLLVGFGAARGRWGLGAPGCGPRGRLFGRPRWAGPGVWGPPPYLLVFPGNVVGRVGVLGPLLPHALSCPRAAVHGAAEGRGLRWGPGPGGIWLLDLAEVAFAC